MQSEVAGENDNSSYTLMDVAAVVTIFEGLIAQSQTLCVQNRTKLR